MAETNTQGQKNLFRAAIVRIAALAAIAASFALGLHFGRSTPEDPGVPAGAQCAAIAPSTVEERNAVWTVLNGTAKAEQTPAGAMATVIQALLGPDASRSPRQGISIYANKMMFSFTEEEHKEFAAKIIGDDRAAAAGVLIRIFRADAHTASIAVDCLSDRTRMQLYYEGKPIPLEE